VIVMMVRGLTRGMAGVALAAIASVAATGVAHAECFTGQHAVPAQTIVDFLTGPTQYLQKYPNGGPTLSATVRDLVGSDSVTLPVVLKLVSGASASQVNAIGAGLGQAALACLNTDQKYATKIQDAVAALDNKTLSLAFAEVSGDKPTTSVGGPSGVVGQTGPSLSPGSIGAIGFSGSSSSSSVLPSFFGTRNSGPTFFITNSGGSNGPVTVSAPMGSVSQSR
jgi:hypothetical protein